MRSPLSRSQTPTAPRRAVGFFGFGRSPSRLGSPITQPTLDWPRFILGQPFQPSTEAKVNVRLKNVNAAFRCSMWISQVQIVLLQALDQKMFMHEAKDCSDFCTRDSQCRNKSQGMFVGGNQAKGLTGSILLSILMTADVRFSGLCRWWVPWQSRVSGHWRCHR
jgi:hypothetical protein